MCLHNCGEIPVLDEHAHPIGVITDRDIVCRVISQGLNPAGHTAARYMTRPVITIRRETTLDEALQMMQWYQIRRIPVVDDQGCCVGILSQADIAREWIEHDVAALVREVSREERDPNRIVSRAVRSRYSMASQLSGS